MGQVVNARYRKRHDSIAPRIVDRPHEVIEPLALDDIDAFAEWIRAILGRNLNGGAIQGNHVRIQLHDSEMVVAINKIGLPVVVNENIGIDWIGREWRIVRPMRGWPRASVNGPVGVSAVATPILESAQSRSSISPFAIVAVGAKP